MTCGECGCDNPTKKVKLTKKQDQNICKDSALTSLYIARNWLHGTYDEKYPNKNKVEEALSWLKDAGHWIDNLSEIFTY